MSQTIRVPENEQYVKNYVVYMGDTLSDQAATVYDGDTLADASESTWKMRIEVEKTGTLFLQLTNGSGITFPDGKFFWQLTAAQTSTMTPGKRYKYDIQRTRPDGIVKTFQRGIMVPKKDTTQA